MVRAMLYSNSFNSIQECIARFNMLIYAKQRYGRLLSYKISVIAY